MIVLNFDTDINSYAKQFTKIYKDVLVKLHSGRVVCPLCNGFLKYNCTYTRTPKEADGTRLDIEIIQVYCESCGRTHALIPDFLMPYKRYSTETIEAAVSCDINEADCAADNSTIYRWKRQFRRRGAKAVLQICLILMEVYQRSVSAVKFIGVSLIKQLAVCITDAGISKPTTVIGAVNVFLSRANAGFI